MPYVCIMEVDGTKATKISYQPSEGMAQSHLLDHPELVDAYYVQTPTFPEWRWVCDTVSKTITDRGPLTQEEEDAIEDDRKESSVNRVLVSDDAIKAFALAVLDEINLLRSEHSLAPRTVQQLRDAIKSKL